MPFPQARYHFRNRADVLCYNTETRQHEMVKNVLFRDYYRTGSSTGDEDTADDKRSYGGEEEEDIVFQWTKRKVAVKECSHSLLLVDVNCVATMPMS